MIVLVVVVVLVVAIFYGMYASMIVKKNSVQESLAGVDVQLTRRFDLIPEMLTIAKRYLTHEENLLSEIAKLRSSVSGGLKNLSPSELKQKIEAGQQLEQKVGGLFAVMENYPNLKADGPLMKAMTAYQDAEDNISAARRFYNSAVKDFNIAAETFPSSLVASFLKLPPYPFFEATEDAKKKINAKDYL